jgi:hypothetical protein
MRHMMRSLATSVAVGLAIVATLGTVTAAGVHAQVAQPDYGAGPGVAAGVPLATGPSTPPGVLGAQPVSPGVQAAVPGVRPVGPGVQQGGPVAATTLPRTGGMSAGDGTPWQFATLGALLLALLGMVGAIGRRAGQSA